MKLEEIQKCTLDEAEPGFDIASSGWLRRRGLRGVVRVRLVAEGLLLEGKRGGSLVIRPDQIRTLRSGTSSGKHSNGGHYFTRLYTASDIRPVLLTAAGNRSAEYDYIVSTLAARVAERGGLRTLETGTTRIDALGVFALLSLPLLFTIFVVVFALADTEGPLRYVPLLIGIGVQLVAVVVFRNFWPRQARSFEEYLKVLRRQNRPLA